MIETEDALKPGEVAARLAELVTELAGVAAGGGRRADPQRGPIEKACSYRRVQTSQAPGGGDGIVRQFHD
jgi:hypothetical protein